MDNKGRDKEVERLLMSLGAFMDTRKELDEIPPG